MVCAAAQRESRKNRAVKNEDFSCNIALKLRLSKIGFMNGQEVNASIITIGDELLIGQTIDTNSAYIATTLNKIGIWIKRRVAVGDVKEEILRALEEERRTSQIVLITGGLGPTGDDITKPVLCSYFNAHLVVNQDALENVKAIFRKINRPLSEQNTRQAEVPHNCTVLQNRRGTAPG